MAEDIKKLEKKRKSGLLAAGLNLLLPGVGYMYCGRWFLGIVVIPFMIGMFYFAMTYNPFMFITLWAVLIIDGFLAANRYNKKLETKIEAGMKTCPMCAEKVLPAAKVCKHCGHKFSE